MARYTKEQVLEVALEIGLSQKEAEETMRDLGMGLNAAFRYFSNLPNSVQNEEAAFAMKKKLQEDEQPIAHNSSTIDWMMRGGGGFVSKKDRSPKRSPIETLVIKRESGSGQ